MALRSRVLARGRRAQLNHEEPLEDSILRLLRAVPPRVLSRIDALARKKALRTNYETAGVPLRPQRPVLRRCARWKLKADRAFGPVEIEPYRGRLLQVMRAKESGAESESLFHQRYKRLGRP